MSEKNMTALVSCFVRAYHFDNCKPLIFSDSLAKKNLTPEEYLSISTNLSLGIKFFNPNFEGSPDEALRWIVNHELSPSVLGRSAFCEDSLYKSYLLGCHQYLIFASGYDTFAYRYPLKNLHVFELDLKPMLEDKQSRLNAATLSNPLVSFISCNLTTNDWPNSLMNSPYKKNSLSFSSLLGISYYLTKKEFTTLIKNISKIISPGSSIIFDYPNQNNRSSKNENLANEAGSPMKSTYSYQEIKTILASYDFLIYEHHTGKTITERYFTHYNDQNKNDPIIAPSSVDYCLAVKNPLHK